MITVGSIALLRPSETHEMDRMRDDQSGFLVRQVSLRGIYFRVPLNAPLASTTQNGSQSVEV